MRRVGYPEWRQYDLFYSRSERSGLESTPRLSVRGYQQRLGLYFGFPPRVGDAFHHRMLVIPQFFLDIMVSCQVEVFGGGKDRAEGEAKSVLGEGNPRVISGTRGLAGLPHICPDIHNYEFLFGHPGAIFREPAEIP